MIQHPSTNKNELLSDMVKQMASLFSCNNEQELYKAIIERESLGSTHIGLGCAIPHAHVQRLDDTVIIVANLASPIVWDKEDEERVALVFLVVGPPKNAHLHMRILSTLARILHDHQRRLQLTSCCDVDEFYSLLCEKER